MKTECIITEEPIEAEIADILNRLTGQQVMIEDMNPMDVMDTFLTTMITLSTTKKMKK